MPGSSDDTQLVTQAKAITQAAKVKTASAAARSKLSAAGVHSVTSAPAKGKFGAGTYTSKVVPLGNGTSAIALTKVKSLADPTPVAKAQATKIIATKAAATNTVVAHPPAAGHAGVRTPTTGVGSSAGGGAAKVPAKPKANPVGSIFDGLGVNLEVVVIGVALFVVALIILRSRKRKR